MNRQQKLKTVEQTLKVLTEGKEEILLENPIIASLLRMGLMKYLFGDTVDKVVGKIKSSKDDNESASDILKKAGLDVKADDEEIEDYLEDDKLSDEELENLGVEDEDISQYTSEEDFSFYTRILRGLDVPLSKSNYFFLYGIAQTEFTKAKYNPFATTMKMPGSKLFGTNVAGVQSYSDEKEGIKATVDTMKLKYYKSIVDAMKQNDGSDWESELEDVAEKWVASPWGTKTLMPTIHGYISGNEPKPKAISRS
jgi:hypothetical protein